MSALLVAFCNIPCRQFGRGFNSTGINDEWRANQVLEERLQSVKAQG